MIFCIIFNQKVTFLIMKSQIKNQPRPYIINKQAVLSILQFTPISAFLSLVGVGLTFTVPPLSPLPFLVLLTPLYINTHSYAVGIFLIIVSLVWPSHSQSNQIVVRIALIMNSLYLMGSINRAQKYRMLPTQVPNEGVPILL